MTTGVIETAIDAACAAARNRPPAPVLVSDPGVAAQLEAAGQPVERGAPAEVGEGTCAAALLVGDELSHAGEQAEGLAHHLARVLLPEGLLAVTVRNREFAVAADLPPTPRPFSADELRRLLGHYGFTPTLLCAPGAAARVRSTLRPEAGDDPSAPDLPRDRAEGLLGAAPQLFALATSARDLTGRSERFFATLPRKVVAASVLCRADDGRLLCVHDTFKAHWTIPGGVIDADENPRAGAEREAWEETGLRIAAGAVLGVFVASWPDRVVLVYDGLPVGGGAPPPAPVHEHEIDAAEWLDVPEALTRLAPHVAFQVRRCLAEPGGTWAQPGPA